MVLLFGGFVEFVSDGISTGKCSGSGTVNKSALESLNQVFCLRVKPSHNLKEFYVADKGRRKW